MLKQDVVGVGWGGVGWGGREGPLNLNSRSACTDRDFQQTSWGHSVFLSLLPTRAPPETYVLVCLIQTRDLKGKKPIHLLYYYNENSHLSKGLKSELVVETGSSSLEHERPGRACGGAGRSEHRERQAGRSL